MTLISNILGPVIILGVEKGLWLVRFQDFDENVETAGELRDQSGTAFGPQDEHSACAFGPGAACLAPGDRVSALRRSAR